MKIKSINVINKKNKWSESKDKLIHMVLDLGEFEEKPSNKIEGFYERIKEYLPSLKSHRCSEGKPGGFFKRIKDGTWMGHIIEHVALELQTLAGMNTGWGRTRGVKGQKGVYNVVFNYENEDIGKLAAREAFNVVTDIINDRDPQIDRIVKKLKPKKNLQESIRRVLREESTQYSLYEIIITENQQESIKIELQSMVKNIGWELTAKIVNGPKNLIKLAFNNNPMEFLNLFNDLNVVQSREEFYWSLFRYKKRNNLMIYDRKNNSLNVNKKIFWSFLEEGFGLNHSKIRELMRIWLYDTYNLKGDRTFELIPIFDWDKSSLSRMG